MKPYERRILTELLKDARLQLTELSRRTKTPVSTVYDFMKHRFAKYARTSLVLTGNVTPADQAVILDLEKLEPVVLDCDHGRTELDTETGRPVCLDCDEEPMVED